MVVTPFGGGCQIDIRQPAQWRWSTTSGFQFAGNRVTFVNIKRSGAYGQATVEISPMPAVDLVCLVALPGVVIVAGAVPVFERNQA
jgi:hypothetical protein